jgi:DNA repair exonuclease SbcCD ATPase subunit
MHSLRRKLDALVAKKATLITDKAKKKKTIKSVTRELNDYTEALDVLTVVAKIVQVKVKTRVESLLSMAIRSVFTERDFVFELQSSKDKSKFTPIIKEGDSEFVPKDEMGRSIIDVISFAFRVVLWTISSPRTRNLFILDEPFTRTGDLISMAGEMLRTLSRELRFQVIIISHLDELIEFCDKVWRVRHDGTKSIVKLIKGRKIKRRQ